MTKSTKDHFATAKEAGNTYLEEMGRFLTFFVLVVTISNLTLKLFGFRLVPLVRTAFDAFHDWCHFLANIFFYSWFTYCIESFWYGITWIVSLLFPIIPWRPYFTIPELVTDFALVSLAFTRVFQTADSIVPRSQREKAEKDMTPQQWKEIELVEGTFWGPIHRFFERTNAGIWNLIHYSQRFLTYPLRRFSKYSIFIRRLLITFAGSFLMWGYIRLPGYLINLYAARRLNSPIMSVRRRFFKSFALSLLGAIGATLVFIVINGWLVEWMEP